MKTVAIVQARMGSTRLPGKVMMDLGGKPLLQHVIERIRESEEVDSVMVATSDSPRDSEISHLCNALDLLTYRGEERDVLGRYVESALIAGAELVVRITGDCPLVEPSVIDRCVKAIKRRPYNDYVTNCIKRTYPRGLDVEVFWRDTLTRLDRISGTEKAREHVTWMTRERADLFIRESIVDRQDNSSLRWCVDTSEDLAAMRALIGAGAKSYKSRLAYARAHPECRVNANVEQKTA